MQQMTEPVRDKDQIEKMKTALLEKGDKYYVMFMIGIDTGMQISDILNLKVKDVEGFDHVTVKDQHGKDRTFHFSFALRRCIGDYIAAHNYPVDAYLIPGKYRAGAYFQMNSVQAYRVLHEAGLKAGLPNVGTRTPRKTYGYWYYQKTHDLNGLRKLFGQASTKETARYLCLTEEDLNPGTGGLDL